MSADGHSRGPRTFGSGVEALDRLLQGVRVGDNVVWQVDSQADYASFAESFMTCSIGKGLKCVYVRFAAQAPVLKPRRGLKIVTIDPSPGFDFFVTAIHHIIEKNGKGVCYVFDNLSDLVSKWATDELLANFFQFTCPYLFEMDTVTYFALTRNEHSPGTVARIRDTTQVLLDLYHVDDQAYIHPLKVWDRYSSDMFLPHLIAAANWLPVSRSGEAAALSATASKRRSGVLSASIAPWDSVYSKLVQYQSFGASLPEASREMSALQRELTRMLLGNHPAFAELADRYLELSDLMRIRARMIGSGRIGGKAAGMLVARKILAQDEGRGDLSSVLEEHDSFYVGSDVFFTFLVNNNLFRLKLQLSRDSQISREEFERVEQQFLEGQFPTEIVEQFRDLLGYFGQAPIIVRSSSLLEDSFGNAFAGKYRSEFCANQGNPDQRLESFQRAIKLVYASVLNPDALLYRRKRGLGGGDEQMAVLVQRVSGMPYEKFFFPPLAGVAFSRNPYVWTDRIDPKQGMIRLVFGLGTQAVNRVGGDYPRMIAVSHPNLRPEVGNGIAKYSQRNIDLLDLQLNEFVTRPVRGVLEHLDYPNLEFLASAVSEGFVADLGYGTTNVSASNVVLTFNKLIAKTDLVRLMGEILARLEAAWGQPVDIEFTATIEQDRSVRVNLLQCRPLRLPRMAGSVAGLPQIRDARRVLFTSDRAVNGGIIDTITYVIYIDPDRYARAPIGVKRSLGRVVGKLNERLGAEKGQLMAIGPGRWGSTNIDLGVNVGYADIDNVAVLVEVGRADSGNEPELSYGTHFFQDLVEGDVIYLPVVRDRPDSKFNAGFFARAPNMLGNLLPEYGDLSSIVRVIDVPGTKRGARVHVAAEVETRRAVCYLGQPKTPSAA